VGTITFFVLAEGTIQLFHLVATSVVDLYRVFQSMWISWLKWSWMIHLQFQILPSL